MQIEFDLFKDRANQEKHGVSLALAIELDWDAALIWVDDRFEYNEKRMIALAPEDGRFSTTWPLLIEGKFAGSSACAAPIVVR